MKDNLDLNFGLIIAFLLPGFVFLFGISLSFEDVSLSLTTTATKETTVGAFLLVMLASIAIGLMVSAVRWMVIDQLLTCTGIKAPVLDFSRLQQDSIRSAFLVIVENHYRYYQYYANTLVSVIAALAAYIFYGNESVSWVAWLVIMFILLALFLGARDSLKKYYSRTSEVLRQGGLR
jgi:hypothetical protein